MVNEITLYRGNNRTIELTITDKNTELPYDLTNCTIVMYVKKNIDDSDTDSIISKSTTTSIEAIITDPEEGIVEFYIVPNDTINASILKNNIPYPVDFRVTTPDSKVYTVLRSWFTILAR